MKCGLYHLELSEFFILTTFYVLILWMKYRPHYNLNQEGIAINGQNLPIDSSLFATSNKQGPIVDSGTTLTYLLDEVYDGFVSAVSS